MRHPSFPRAIVGSNSRFAWSDGCADSGLFSSAKSPLHGDDALRTSGRRSIRPTRAAATAFTLLELLLTLAVLAVIASITIPQIGILLGDRRIVRAGDMLRVEMTRLRVEAMREGRVMMLEGMMQEGMLRAKPFYSTADSTEAFDQTGTQQGMLSGANQGVVTAVIADPTAEEMIELPEDIVVAGVGVVSAARSMEIEQLNLANQSEGWSRPILFYPDGTTSTAAVTLSHESMGKVVVKLRGITGDVTVSEVLPL